MASQGHIRHGARATYLDVHRELRMPGNVSLRDRQLHLESIHLAATAGPPPTPINAAWKTAADTHPARIAALEDAVTLIQGQLAGGGGGGGGTGGGGVPSVTDTRAVVTPQAIPGDPPTSDNIFVLRLNAASAVVMLLELHSISASGSLAGSTNVRMLFSTLPGSADYVYIDEQYTYTGHSIEVWGTGHALAASPPLPEGEVRIRLARTTEEQHVSARIDIMVATGTVTLDSYA